MQSSRASEQTPRLAEFESLEYGMFICYGLSTFVQQELDFTHSPSTLYDPTTTNTSQWTEQWMSVAAQAGMKYAIFTSKHVNGHALWDSDAIDNYNAANPGNPHGFQKYDVTTSSHTDDVVAAYVDSALAHDIIPALYYCYLDANLQPELASAWETWNPYGNYPASQASFEVMKEQVRELVTRPEYAGVEQLWLDVPCKVSLAQRQELYDMVKGIDPDILVLQSQTTFNHQADRFMPTDILCYESSINPVTEDPYDPFRQIGDDTFYIPAEAEDVLNPHWYYLNGEVPFRSEQGLYNLYHKSVDRGANFVLNVSPDQSGFIPQVQVDALLGLKARLDDDHAFINGSFESGNHDGGVASGYVGVDNLYDGNTSLRSWAIDGPVGWWYLTDAFADASDGARSVNVASGGGAGDRAMRLSQTFDTIAGQEYLISFDLSKRWDALDYGWPEAVSQNGILVTVDGADWSFEIPDMPPE